MSKIAGALCFRGVRGSRILDAEGRRVVCQASRHKTGLQRQSQELRGFNSFFAKFRPQVPGANLLGSKAREQRRYLRTATCSQESEEEALFEAEGLLRLSTTLDTTKPESAGYDCVVLVCPPEALKSGCQSTLKPLLEAVDAYSAIDAAARTTCAVHPLPGYPGGRLVYSPASATTRDFDDVRGFAEAAQVGVARAIAAGSRCPLLAVHVPDALSSSEKFSKAVEVAALGGLEATYLTPQVAGGSFLCGKRAVDYLGLLVPTETSEGEQMAAEICRWCSCVEHGRSVARDVAGGDPELMSAPNVASYAVNTFESSECVNVGVLESTDAIELTYPLLGAVARASKKIARHAPRVIDLEYVGEGEIEKTIMIVGKGVTYDTGGADLKVGGSMAGMHRDKGGAAATLGLFAALAELRPRGIKVIGKCAMVRNSIGSDSFVSDEVLLSRSGRRVRIGNTDAEGRLAMADLLCHMREMAANEVNPHLLTVATLTGHVVRAYGPNYTAVMDNSTASQESSCVVGAASLAKVGEEWGDPCEISTIRREDFKFVSARYPMQEDLLQSNNAATVNTPRGHQFPAAFMIEVSGLHEHGYNSSEPLPYTHLDVAGSAGSYPSPPTAKTGDDPAREIPQTRCYSSKGPADAAAGAEDFVELEGGAATLPIRSGP
ncbi:hypothetical protein CYMTET_8936 [Cymbomonas tetramitiformis]|uniref:Cytosol aminopeptidase domain-containing protein n=1 Tax=Cymbomonas tetramitiformis TaxID=36881 RepID=A0AAE0GSG6_9CHLO|nr:hypothetical protein CYMTET_8936 [Cymbomonas tetramitiformis]